MHTRVFISGSSGGVSIGARASAGRSRAATLTACTDPPAEASHLYDDDLLRRVKIARLAHPAAHSQQPRGRCHHLLQESAVLRCDAAANRFELRTPFIYTEPRAGRTTTLPGVAWQHLVVHEGALRITLKRVDLLHAEEPLRAVEFYI